MKKKIYIFALAAAFSFGSTELFAQKGNVGIGTTTPDNSAVLDIQSASKGVLIPRMTLQQRDAILNPATGLMVYQTDLLAGFYFYDGKEWKPLTSATEAKSVAGTDGDWTIGGNTITSTDFIGSINKQPLNFKVNNVKSGTIGTDVTFNTFLGYESGLSITAGTNNTGFGYNALKLNTTGNNNTAFGTNALRDNVFGSDNFAFGLNSLRGNTEGVDNVGIGSFSLFKNTTGKQNTAIGKSALEQNTIGNFNTAIGLSAHKQATTGGFNTSIGGNANRLNTIGEKNTVIGYAAGYASTGSSNIFIGNEAGYNETGSNKLYLANTNTANPLIKGEFDNKNLKINTGATTSSTVGFLAVGNFDATFTMPTSNSYRLIVQDGIITEKVKVALRTTADWADYVFEPSYQLLPLESVEQFTKENRHLPNVPSAEQMATNGLDVSQTSKMFMEKIEELTLYMIELNKEVKTLKAENEQLKTKVK